MDAKEAPRTVEGLEGVIKKLLEENAALKEENSNLRAKYEDLKETKFEELRKSLFGPRSERFLDNDQPWQSYLFDEMEDGLSPEEIANELSGDDSSSEDIEEITYKRKKRRKGPQPLPDHLPREIRVIDLPEEEKYCPHGHPLDRIGERTFEELDYIPAQARVIKYVYPTYCTKSCCFTACGKPRGVEPPARPLDDARASTGLVAHVAVSKYSDHLPLYRQSQMLAREGIELSRSTLCGWVMRIAVLLAPIVEEMKRELLARSYLQADETTLRTLKAQANQKPKTAYLWAYGIPWGEVVYDFALGRSGKYPVEFLKGFDGALQIDGYDGYNGVFESGKVVRLGCFAHMRRKFYAAVKTSPEEAKVVLDALRRLYKIEREMKESEFTPERRASTRKEHAKPILDKLYDLLLAYRDGCRPTSPLGKAINYALNEWKYLTRYVDVGEAEIDNNGVEHTMRPVALGRKNFLFAGSPEGGKAAATLYSLITTCRRLGIEPREYLRDVLDRISTHPARRISELTPRAWKAARAPVEEPACA